MLGDMHVWCGATCRICSREYTSNTAGPFLSAIWKGGSHILGAYCDLDTVQLDSNHDPRIRMTSIQLFFRGSPLWALSDKSYQRLDRSLRRPRAPVTDQTNAEFLSFKLRHLESLATRGCINTSMFSNSKPLSNSLSTSPSKHILESTDLRFYFPALGGCEISPSKSRNPTSATFTPECTFIYQEE